MCRAASARLEMPVYNVKRVQLHGTPSLLQKVPTSRNQSKFKCKFR
jgi:hypothetical protein